MAADAIAAIPLATIYEQPLQAAYVASRPAEAARQRERLQPRGLLAVRQRVRTMRLNLAHVTTVAAFVRAVLSQVRHEYGTDGDRLVRDVASAGACPVTLHGHALDADAPELAPSTATVFPISYGVYDRNPAAVVGIGKTAHGELAVEVVAKCAVDGPEDALCHLPLRRVHLLKAKDLLLCAAVQIVCSDVRAGASLDAAAMQLEAQMDAFDAVVANGLAISAEAPYTVNWLPFTDAEADFAFGTKASVDEMPALAALLGVDAPTDVPHMLRPAPA